MHYKIIVSVSTHMRPQEVSGGVLSYMVPTVKYDAW